MTLMSVMSGIFGAFGGLMLWLLVAEVSRWRRWNTIIVGAAGMVLLVGGIWGLKWLLEMRPLSEETVGLLETFVLWTVVGYLLTPIRLVSRMTRGSAPSGSGKPPATYRDYCALLTVAFALGLVVFGGIGVPASLMRFGALGSLTLLALLVGVAMGVTASRRFDRHKPVAYPKHHSVYGASPLPFIGMRTFALLFATATATFLFY